MKNSKARNARKRRQARQHDYPQRAARAAKRGISRMPKGVTVATRKYGIALYVGAQFVDATRFKGERIGGFETYEEGAFYAHKHLQTRQWKNFEKHCSTETKTFSR